MGDTAISLHIQVLDQLTHQGEGEGSGKSKLKVPRSVQISIFEGGGILESQNSKYQDLPRCEFFLGGGVSGKSKPKVPRYA